ncbi:MAG: hypothetical protein IPN45_03325 [Actinomycetales bacterium]|nr:hypothetical protein [Actinomycetales bacterium]
MPASRTRPARSGLRPASATRRCWDPDLRRLLQVTLTGDTDGTSNNDACVPVQEPKKAISLQKFGMNCDVNVSTCPVGGAQFAIYSVDPRTSGAAPIPGGITPNAMVSNGVPCRDAARIARVCAGYFA